MNRLVPIKDDFFRIWIKWIWGIFAVMAVLALIVCLFWIELGLALVGCTVGFGMGVVALTYAGRYLEQGDENG